MSTTKIQNDNLFHINSNNFPGGGGSGGSNSDQCQVMPTFILQGPHDRVIKFCRQITPYVPYGSDTVYTKNSYQSYRHPLPIITKQQLKVIAMGKRHKTRDPSHRPRVSLCRHGIWVVSANEQSLQKQRLFNICGIFCMCSARLLLKQ